MTATERSPTLRFLTLAAILIAAGILALRAYDLFGSTPSERVGSAIEQELTYLLEPITGADKVRVAVTPRSPKTVLIMIDGEMASDLRPLRLRIEKILIPALDFNPEQDTLTLSQFPFARGVGTGLTPLQLTELSSLALLCLLLIATLIRPQSAVPAPSATRSPRPAEPLISGPARARESVERHPPEQASAAALAEAKPNETARLVRDWMSYAED